MILTLGIDKRYIDQLGRYLQECHFIRCYNPLQLDKTLMVQPIDFVILSYQISGISIIDLCRELHKKYVITVMVIGDKIDINREVELYECGITDYIHHEVDIKIVAAKIRSTLIRLKRKSNKSPQSVFFNGFCLDVVRKCVVDIKGKHHRLTLSEFLALSILLNKPYQVVSRDELCWYVYGRPYDGLDRTVDVLISKLRKKLPIESTEEPLITTINRAGYMFRARLEYLNESQAQQHTENQKQHHTNDNFTVSPH
ncbi:response regulator transcription factor [Caedibacter taeniospiralis]|uniref:response regulator transcription factor n=1 Tax=Caedibacter taeniospiralis TaxID=28907 RepID=UPI000C272DD4|nr:response regulator transcription factor [Caedibacter taeniospiralis]